jgi:hypothetical protein
MEKEYVLWLLIVAQAITFAGFGYVFTLSNRLTRLETMWAMISKQAAEILHSPHFHESGFDELLEKLVKTYEDKHYELSLHEWEKLQDLAQQIKEDVNEPKGTRLLAAMVYAQCCHKLLCGEKEYFKKI